MSVLRGSFPSEAQWQFSPNTSFLWHYSANAENWNYQRSSLFSFKIGSVQGHHAKNHTGFKWGFSLPISSTERQIKKKNESTAWSRQRDSIWHTVGHRWEWESTLSPTSHTFKSTFQTTPMTLGGRQPDCDWQVTESLGTKGVTLIRQLGHSCTVNVPGFEQNVLLTSQAHSKCFKPKPCDIKLGDTGGMLTLSWRSCKMTFEGPSSSRILITITMKSFKMSLFQREDKEQTFCNDPLRQLHGIMSPSDLLQET